MRSPTLEEHDIEIPLARLNLAGTLTIPADADALVLFVHGSGSSRFSPRNRFVAALLQQAGLATLLMDILSIQEEHQDAYTGDFRFDIGLLSDRVLAATDWLHHKEIPQARHLGLFGSSTGAAAALVAAARRPEAVASVVSRGGRPDLASDNLRFVRAPTLLIVGGLDTVVIPLNETAAEVLTCPHELVIVPGASHLFEEPGKLEEVATLARAWFLSH